MNTRPSDGPTEMDMEMEGDAEDLMLHKHPSMTMLNDKELLRQTGRRTIQNFLRSHKCYDLLRNSGKVVVFDTNIPFQLAFYALVEHDIKAAPLWDSTGRRFVGVMVITDFIDTVRDYYGKGVTMTDVAAKSIAQVVRDPEGHRMFHSEFWHGTADDTVYHACELIVKKKLRFLPIMNPEENLMLSVLSQFDILDYLVNTFREQRKLFEQSIFELNIGVFGSIITMSHTSRLYEVLEVMERWNISAIPIVDDDNRVIDLYHRFDVTFIAVAGDVESTMSNLNMIVGDLLEQRKGGTLKIDGVKGYTEEPKSKALRCDREPRWFGSSGSDSKLSKKEQKGATETKQGDNANPSGPEEDVEKVVDDVVDDAKEELKKQAKETAKNTMITAAALYTAAEMTQEVVSSAVDKVKSTVTGKKGDSNTQKPSGEEQRDTHQHQKDE